MLRVDGFQIHSISIVDDAVQDGFCQRAVLTAELVEPFSVVVLRAEDGGCMASTFVDELCNLTAFLLFSVKQISPFSSSEFPIVIVGKSPLSAGLVRKQVPLLHPAA